MIIFDEARAYLYVEDGFGKNIDLNPEQAIELLDFLLGKAEVLASYVASRQALEAILGTDDTEAELRALDRLDQYLAGDEEAQHADS